MYVTHYSPTLTCFRAQIHPQTFHSTRLPLASPAQTCHHHHYNQQKHITLHYLNLPNNTQRTHPQCPKQPPHHRSLPRAILPPDRPHPRQSPPVARRAGDYRRRRPDQCLLEPRMSQVLILLIFCFCEEEEQPKKEAVFDCGTNANATLPGLTPPAQPRRRDHRQGAE